MCVVFFFIPFLHFEQKWNFMFFANKLDKFRANIAKIHAILHST